MIPTYEIDPLYDSRWSELVAAHPHASVFHTREWLIALKIAYGYRPFVLTTSSPDDSLTDGIAFCEIDSWLTGRRLVSLPFSDHCDPLVTDAESLKALLLYASQMAQVKHFKRIELRPRTVIGDQVAGFCPKNGALLHRLDLKYPSDHLFRNFHKDCIQRKIRRAERENLRYEEGNSEAQLLDFYRLMTITRRRHGLPPQPIRWLRALIESFGSDLKIRIARKDTAAVASIITLVHRNTIVYKYGCSDASANKLGGMSMLFWKTIQEAKVNGQTELDMGRSDLENPGLSAFKQHLGAEPTPLIYWRYPDESPRVRRFWTENWMNRAVTVSPGRVLQLVGSVLYRHMG